VATSAADEVLCRQIVGTVRAGDMYRDAVVVLVETDQGVTPRDVRVVFRRPVRQAPERVPVVERDFEQLGVRYRVRSNGKPANNECERVLAVLLSR